MTFSALFFKGDLKELKLEEWNKRDNENRKILGKKFKEALEKEKLRKESLSHKILYPFKKITFFLISMTKWIVLKILYTLSRIESWLVR